MNRGKLLFGLKILGVFTCLYLFIVGVGGMGEAFKLFGEDFAERVITATSNPLTALLIGILATSLVQSSSTSTSIIVGMVAGGALTLDGAVFMIMGANIGTSITSMLVSLGHANRPEELRRAFSASTVHSSFNLCAAAVLFPIELATGYLRSLAAVCGNLFEGVGGMRLSNPLKAATEPTIDFLAFIVQGQPILLLLLAIALTYGMLVGIVKLLRSLVLHKLEAFFDKHLFRNWRRAMFFGLFFTFAVQTSSVPTALVVPLAAAGILKLAQVYPYCLGSNLGTTMTAMLAALATGESLAIVAAFSHLLFNLSGILVIWSIPPLRRIPIRIAEFCGNTAFHKRWFPFAVVAGIYFIIPFLGILILP